MSTAMVAIVTETSEIQYRMVSPQVIDKNQSLFLILTRFLHVSAKVTNNNQNVKNQCRMVSPQVIDENQSLFLILT